MKRADRLMAILLALQMRNETAQSLASKLEVSRRTIIRDMNALAEMGVPLYATSGPAGGYRLMDGYKLPPLHLDPQEAMAVLFALNAMTKMADTPFNQARWTAIDKIRAAMPASVLQQVEPMLHHMEIEVPDRRYKAPFLERLLQYASESAWFEARYRSEKQVSVLQLLPLRVYSAHGFWYCEAYSDRHREERTFRVDRFQQVEPMKQPPAGRHGNGGGAVKPAAAIAPVRIVARLTYRGALLAEQDTHIGQLVKQMSEHEWLLDFQCPASEREWAVRFFYTLGLDAEVLEPEALKRDIARLVRSMSDRYPE